MPVERFNSVEDRQEQFSREAGLDLLHQKLNLPQYRSMVRESSEK